MGASYGSLLATKLLVRRSQDNDGVPPGRGRGVQQRGCPCPSADQRQKGADRARLAQIAGPARRPPVPATVDPADYDLVVLAMQEPQYRSPGVRELLDAVATQKVPCMSIMNMPPLAYLKRIPGLATDALQVLLHRCERVGQFRAGALDLVQPGPAGHPPAGRKDQRAAGHACRPTSRRPASTPTRPPRSCARCRRRSKRSRYDPGDGPIDLPVKLKVHDSIFVPLAKWAMLLTGNYRCVTTDGAIDIKDAVHSDLGASRSVYNWVCGLCEKLGASPDDLVPFEKYAAAAQRPGAAVLGRPGARQRRAQYRADRPAGAGDRGAVRHAQRRSSIRRSRRSTPGSRPIAKPLPDLSAGGAPVADRPRCPFFLPSGRKLSRRRKSTA